MFNENCRRRTSHQCWHYGSSLDSGNSEVKQKKARKQGSYTNHDGGTNGVALRLFNSNLCYCDHGTAASGSACSTHRTWKCTGCHSGWAINRAGRRRNQGSPTCGRPAHDSSWVGLRRDSSPQSWCASEQGWQGQLRCNRGHISTWERFKLEATGASNEYWLKDYRGKYCADEVNRVVCNRGHRAQWEKFTFEPDGDDGYKMRGGHDGSGNNQKYCQHSSDWVKCNGGSSRPNMIFKTNVYRL